METIVHKSRFNISYKTKNNITDIIAYLYVLLFLYTATSKLLEHEKFQLQISKSPIITDYANILVWMVPAMEIIISVMLLINSIRTVGLYAGFMLMCLFTAYIVAILNFTDHIPCGCGGVLQNLGWTEHLIFNMVFVLLAIAAILLQTKNLKIKADKAC